MTRSRPSLLEPSLRDRRLRDARRARERLPVVWLVLAATIAVVFVIAFVLTALL
jgi:hypothetical protein